MAKLKYQTNSISKCDKGTSINHLELIFWTEKLRNVIQFIGKEGLFVFCLFLVLVYLVLVLVPRVYLLELNIYTYMVFTSYNRNFGVGKRGKDFLG